MNNLFSVEDLCVLISGSSRGIGLALAKGFLKSGSKVSVLSENEDELNGSLSDLKRGFPDRVFGIVCDVRSYSSCQDAIQTAVSQLGRLTTVICNAGVDRIKPIDLYEEADWRFILDVNLGGAFYIAQAAARHYIASKTPGTITFTSSIAGSIGIDGLVPYAASKGGINQLTKTMAVELAKYNIRVNAVAPGYVENIMEGVSVHSDPAQQERIMTFTPLGRRCQLAELVGPYIFLSSQASSYVTGHILSVDGGYTAL